MGDLNVALRLQGTFIDFQPDSIYLVGKKRRRSCPPCLRHGPDNTVELPNGLFYLTRCATRESCYKDLQINEDKDYLWALIERTQRLPQISSQMKEGDDTDSAVPQEPNSPDNEGGWTCFCGIASSSGALFCWSCGASKEAIRPLQSSTRNKPSLAVGRKASNKIGYAKKKSPAEVIQPPTENSMVPLASVTSYFALPSNQSTMDTLPTLAVATADSFPIPNEEVDECSITSHSSQQNASVESTDGCLQEITTLMICALPFQVTSEQLLDAINLLGFAGTYDFLYMPSRSTKKCGKLRPGNVGYAFVNFRKAEDASRFAITFAGYGFPGVDSDKQILVRAATCQGYDANCGLHLFNKKHQSSVMTFPEPVPE